MKNKLALTLAGGLLAVAVGTNVAGLSKDLEDVVEQTRNRPVVNAVATILDRTPLKYILSPRNKFLIEAYGTLKENPQILTNVQKGGGYLAGAGLLGTFLAGSISYRSTYEKSKK